MALLLKLVLGNLSDFNYEFSVFSDIISIKGKDGNDNPICKTE